LAAIEAAIEPTTRAIFVEVVANPTMAVCDLPALAALAKQRRVPLVVDNTFLSPALFRPLGAGADLVIHSTTKYLSGHGNALGGAVCGSRALVGPIRRSLVRLGGTMPAFTAWLTLAGIKTLLLRVERQCANAARLARMLCTHAAVAAVHYPGLPDDPGHVVARGMFGADVGFGGMIAFRLRGGREAQAAFFNGLRFCTLAVSLGECGTLVWPFYGSDLIRLSVGIEDAADIEEDLRRGLDAAASAS
jgi:methionine-gamma-lyase